MHGVLGVVLIAAIVATPQARAGDEDEGIAMRERIAVLEAQLAERDVRIAQLEAEVAALRGERETVVQRQQQLDRREAKIEALAGAVATGDLAARYAANINVDYDPKKDRTAVSAGPVLFEGEQIFGEFYFSAVYAVPGQNAAQQPESVSLFIQTKFSGSLFEGVDSVVFTVDGEPVAVPVAGYLTTRKRSGIPGKNTRNKSDETVTLKVDLATLRRLAEATELSMQTPQTPLVFSQKQRALLRALLLRMAGGGTGMP